jgi:hypothetical protein
MEATMIETNFTCAKCGGATGVVALATPAEPTPIPTGVTGVPPGVDRLFGNMGWSSIALQDFGSFALMGRSDEQIAEYAQAIAAGSAERLYALTPDACPWWCPRCSATYCRACWTTSPRTTSDNLYADCPQGHLRKLWGD